MESRTDVTNFLGSHKVAPDYRAKMVDWIVEVLTTFKCSDQAFFKTIQLLDRYYAEILEPLGTHSLHMTGVVCMFIATKYEDIVPLLMRTIVNKVGHNKFTKQQVVEKELEILRVLQFNLGGPTVLEHLERLSAELRISGVH
jgi:Cyclin, N-terminal domain